MKEFDVICLGRIAVDLYAKQIGSSLEEVSSFSKYLGGSSGNIAFGCARQGLRVSMLARVGADHFGRFIKTQLDKVGVDTSHIIFDEKRLTGLAILGIKDKDTFPLVFYRENCADMAITPEDFSEEYIAKSKSLLITGTHFSTAATARACRTAIDYARRNSVKVILDIDYRPTLWGLTSAADGETRYIESNHVSSHLLSIFPLCDLIVGTEEEFRIGGGRDRLHDCLLAVREVTSAVLVLKRGPLGNSVFDAPLPSADCDWDQVPVYQGVTVEVLNVLGAGDAFMSGFLRGWLNGESHEQSSRYANACGALVVSRHSCAPAIPTRLELDYYLENAADIPFPDRHETLNHLHRVTTRRPPTEYWKNLHILAFDHRLQLEEMAKSSGITDPLAQKKRIISIKKLIGEAVTEVREELGDEIQLGILADERYAQDLLNDFTDQGWWIGRPVEIPGAHPVSFEPSPDIGTDIITWPHEHIIKCLVRCHPGEPPAIWEIQEEKIRQLYHASLKSGNELLLEIIPSEGDSSTLPDLIERIYRLGVKPDWWKLYPTADGEWTALSRHIETYDRHCRGILLLGLNRDIAELKKLFLIARRHPICKGFAIGRSVFHKPALEWFLGHIDDQELALQVKINFTKLIELWKKSIA